MDCYGSNNSYSLRKDRASFMVGIIMILLILGLISYFLFF